MFTCAIVDDEKLAVERLARLLNEIDKDIQILFTANSCEEFEKQIKRYSPTVLFLDIHLVDKLIFDALEHIDYDPYIIFTTAYDEYAIKAFEQGAIDYILKPISKERLELTIDRISKIKKSNKEQVLNYVKQTKVNKIPVKYEEDIVLIDINDIIYIMADNKNVVIVTSAGEYKYHTQMHVLEEKLRDQGFVRVHKSYLISLNHISRIKKWFAGSYLLEMDNGEEIKISRNYQQELFNQIGYH